MSSDFERALADAALLLRTLPRDRHDAHKARGQFERLRIAYPGALPQLVVHSAPASDAIDFDVLLTDPDAGTLSLSWRADDGVPWIPRNADHWASNFVLTVDGFSMTIQSALIYLNGVLDVRPRLMEGLINRSLIDIAIARSPVDVSDEEVEEAVDEFRVTQGLYSGAATQQWLDERQLTMDALREMVRDSAIARKFKAALTASGVEPFFEEHRTEFDRVRLLRVDGLSSSSAETLASAWRRTDVCPALGAAPAFPDCTAKLDSWLARDLPPEFAAAAPGAIVGPLEAADDYCVGQVLSRLPAALDDETRARINALLLEDWLAERRSAAKVQWHWV